MIVAPNVAAAAAQQFFVFLLLTFLSPLSKPPSLTVPVMQI